MKLVVVTLCLLNLVNGNPGILTKNFANLVESLKDEYDVQDMDEIMRLENSYINGMARHEEVYSSAVELLVGEEPELEDDPEEEDEMEEEGEESDLAEDVPEQLDVRDMGIMHEATFQGGCASCGWVSGTQTLEARIAFVSENYIPYSIQDFMNCAGKTCVGAQPFSVNTRAKNKGYIVSEDEMPYTQKKCVREGNCYFKCGYRDQGNYTNTLVDQFIIIAGTRIANTEAAVKKALQEGPLTTCFYKKSVEKGERCSRGCNHANSIIGYTKDTWLLQESYGKKWGRNQDGSWSTNKGSICYDTIIGKARYPKILYDYDRANAYFREIEGGVNEEELKFVDTEIYEITQNDKKNWGTAKNKCAILGSACKGVVALSSGIFELVSDFRVGSSGDQTAFKKVQMVIYLKNDESGSYIGIKEKDGRLKLVGTKRSKAAPFFTSESRFISFQHPRYHMVDDKMKLLVGEVNQKKYWTLNNCNIYNDASGNSFDLRQFKTYMRKTKSTIGGSKFDPSSASQRFNVGLSGKWDIVSSELGLPLAKSKKNIMFTDTSLETYRFATILKFQWNARQIINDAGHPYNPYIEISSSDFKFENKENAMRPRGCRISRHSPTGNDDHLVLIEDKNKAKIVMSSNFHSSWTFEYDDL